MSELLEEKPTAGAPGSNQDLHEAMAARSEALVGTDAAKKLLNMEVKAVVTPSGVETPGDRVAELKTREIQGHSYQR